MEDPYILEKQGDGRFDVLLPRGDHVGFVLGGNGCWVGESANGMTVRVRPTLKAAAQALVAAVADRFAAHA